MKERIIGVDYLEPITRNGMWKFQITVIEGITPIMYQRILVKDFNQILTPLLALSLKYGAKINFENNRCGLYLLFKDRGCLNLLRDNDIPRCLMSNNKEVKGFTYVCVLKDLFNSYSDMLKYDKEFEDSYRIAVLPILYDKTTQYRLQEIKCLERKLKEAKDSL